MSVAMDERPAKPDAPQADALGLGQPHAWGWNGGRCYVSGEAIVIGAEGSAETDRPILEAKAQVIAAKDLMVEVLKRIAAHPYRGGVSPAQARELSRVVLRIAGVFVEDEMPPQSPPPQQAPTAASASVAQHRPKSQFTADQLALLRTCKDAGQGWAKFAASVQGLGHCTPGQEQTLRNMVARIAAMNRGPGRSDSDLDPAFDDASSGDYGRHDYH
jgi:hypothetical protein